MIDTSKPDIRVYHKAAEKVRLGVDFRRAIISSVEDLHGLPKFSFDPNIFNWKWEHLHQYTQAFGSSIKPMEIKQETPTRVRNAQTLLVAASLDLMADLCTAKPSHP